MNPLVSIIIPTYNRAHLIAETLESIQNQTFHNWECIVVDDGSSDSTEMEVQKFSNNDSRIKYFKRPNYHTKGPAGSRNYGLSLALRKGVEFIQFFDDDDIMDRRKIELQIEPLLKESNIMFTICKFDKIFKDKERKITPSFVFPNGHAGDNILIGKLVVNSANTLWRASVFNKFKFDESLSFAEEWELFVRIAYQYPHSFFPVNEILFTYIRYNDTLTFRHDINYEKRKTSSIIRFKLYDYLSENKLHTKTSLKFFAKTFMFRFYDKQYLNKILNQINTSNYFSYGAKLIMRFIFYFHEIYLKIVNSIINFL